MGTHTTSNESAEMYLKTVAELSDEQEPVSLAQIASRLEVTTVSVSEMVKRLVEQGWLEHIKYKGVHLTANGRMVAHSVMRRQRLWECFLVDHLHLNWAGTYEIACRLEHATSSVLAEALAAYLEHPTICPHGNPIPSAGGEIKLEPELPLAELPIGKSAHILNIRPTKTTVYAYLQERRLQPGQMVKVLAHAPLDGPLSVEVCGSEVSLGRKLADLIRVRPLPTAPRS